MKQREIVLGFLLPADDDPPEAVHPTVGSFDYPTADLVTRLAFDFLPLGAPRRDVGRIAEFPHHLLHWVADIGFVQVQVLWLLAGGFGTANRHAFQRRPHQLTVVSMGAGDGKADGQAVSLGQQTAFDPAFGPVGGIGAAFFPHPRGPWSWRHPGLATARDR